ncbi:MAG: sigma-54-dependent Fis family transcriptional regulator [Candidatus Omnitrophota bacterium]|nr:MAG: sigma-54-dependent Fis family transcriptional regulator [Candidatus Omnitrophota bacterium]
MHVIVKPTVLLVDDEESVVRGLNAVLRHRYNTFLSTDPFDAIRIVEKETVDVIILDIKMPKMDGIELLKRFRAIDPSILVIMYTALNEAVTAVKAMKEGATDYCLKPIDPDQLIEMIDRALHLQKLTNQVDTLQEKIDRHLGVNNCVWKSASMADVFQKVEKAAQFGIDVLITGETGTGKELIANAIREKSSRNKSAYITVDCGAIPENLLSSELFGHEKGAFTGAMIRRRGKFELADGGILFLDEIGNTREEVQSALLRVLETREIIRVGGEQRIAVDVWIIAATNKQLEELVQQKKFKGDLFYRLNRFPVNIPPLRERPEDIPLLVDHFLKECAGKYGSRIRIIPDATMEMLVDCPWLGNVRELKNCIEQTCIMYGAQTTLHPSYLPVNVRYPTITVTASRNTHSANSLSSALESLEKEMITEALKVSDWNQTHAAKRLGIPRSSLQRRITKYDIQNFNSLS